MPIATAVILLPAAGPSLLGDYLTSLADRAADPPDLIAVPVSAEPDAAALADLDSVLPAPAAEVIARLDLSGRAGEIAETIARVGPHTLRLAFLGIGDSSPAALRRAGAELGRRLADGKSATVATIPGGAGREALQPFAEGIMLGSYRFSLKSAGTQTTGPQTTGPQTTGRAGTARLLVREADEHSAPVARAEAIAGAVALARDLANTPSATKSPRWLADEAVRVAGESGLTARIWPEAELQAHGFGGILAVGSGSARPPRLIELSYEPQGARTHVVLVGKGITFDSGGLSLKPNDAMKLMKTDMAGGAAVIAAMSALARLGISHRVTGLVAAAENLPSGSAYRPGDVITQFGGRTVEVLNTDAEGRLVLADALAYADAVLEPDQVVDLATLTGAARIALGTSHAALYCTSDEMAAGLIAAGRESGDRVWRMPLVDEYADALESPVADLAHVARDNAPAGSILAALFLREFTGGRAWAHLDIAGAARSTADDGEVAKGATGFGTRLLLSWLGG
ncbi:MAG TPA: leucyl aminopeptidase [Streptosporangiaceae bacterium]